MYCRERSPQPVSGIRGVGLRKPIRHMALRLPNAFGNPRERNPANPYGCWVLPSRTGFGSLGQQRSGRFNDPKVAELRAFHGVVEFVKAAVTPKLCNTATSSVLLYMSNGVYRIVVDADERQRRSFHFNLKYQLLRPTRKTKHRRRIPLRYHGWQRMCHRAGSRLWFWRLEQRTTPVARHISSSRTDGFSRGFSRVGNSHDPISRRRYEFARVLQSICTTGCFTPEAGGTIIAIPHDPGAAEKGLNGSRSEQMSALVVFVACMLCAAVIVLSWYAYDGGRERWVPALVGGAGLLIIALISVSAM